MAKNDLTADELRKALAYDPETGLFKWLRVRTTKGGANYKQMARPNEKGYIRISIGERRYMAHRLAWLYMYGEWPKNEVDHINGVRSDNRIANLRDLPHKQNSQNRRSPNVGNKAGYLGVSPNGKKWVASIKVDGRTVSLGVHESPEVCHELFLAAKRRLHEGCTL